MRPTEFGEIPADWSVGELNGLNPFVTSGSRGWAEFYADRGSPFIRITNMSRETIYLDLSDLKLVNLPAREKEGTRTALHASDVLISITADIGIAAYVDERLPTPAFINQHIALVRLDPKGTDSRFVAYFFASERAQRRFRSSTDIGAKAGMSLVTVRKLNLVLPPLGEQQAISSALVDMDVLLVSLEKLIAKKRDLKQAAMQQLLTGKTRLPGFVGKWQTKRLRDGCRSITDGTHYTPTYVAQGVPFYSVESVTGDDFTNTKFITLTEHRRLIARCKPERGDILLTRIGSIGATKLIDWDVDASIYVSLALLKPKPETSSRFLYSYTKCASFVRDMEERSLMNAAPKKINMGEIGEVPIPAPPPAEQEAIADVLLDMDDEMSALRARLGKARLLKLGMMQELLTGKTRLV